MGSRIIKRVLGRDFTPPSAPTGLTALALDPYRIKLDCNNALDGFSDPGEAVTGIAAYQWQWSTDGVRWGSLADTAVSTYTHEGLQPSTLAFYRVRAMDLAGNVSGFSNVASATTLPVETGNRPPVWNTSSIPVYAYAGQAVSQSIAGFASDPDGDTLTFSEEPTPVLASLGLSLNSNGLLAGTIPSGANPQTATTNISVSDGEYTVVLNAGLTITVLDGADAQADWDARSRADGVFWGCNMAEWVRGIDGYTSQPTKDYPSGPARSGSHADCGHFAGSHERGRHARPQDVAGGHRGRLRQHAPGCRSGCKRQDADDSRGHALQRRLAAIEHW
jgi:hypothetical protein